MVAPCIGVGGDVEDNSVRVARFVEGGKIVAVEAELDAAGRMIAIGGMQRQDRRARVELAPEGRREDLPA